ARQKSGNVFKRDQRDVEAIAKAHETRTLHRRIDIESACQIRRLVGDNADGAAIHAGKSDDDVFGVVLLDFEEVAVVNDGANRVLDVVGQIRLRRNNGIEGRFGAINWIGTRLARWIVEIVRRDETE